MAKRQQIPRYMYPNDDDSHSTGKKRYGSKQQARERADILELQNPGLELDVYQDIDGGWYLTSVKRPDAI